MAVTRDKVNKYVVSLCSRLHFIKKPNSRQLVMTRCFSFVAPSLSPWVGKVLPPWAGRFSVGLGPAVFRFWPVAVCWLFCGGRVSVGPAVFQACAVGRASVGLAVFRFGLAVLGIGRGRASLGQNLPASAVKNHTFQLHSLNSRTTTKDSQAMN